MGYSVYPKLRAIYSFIPTSKDIDSLIMAESVLDFKNRFERMTFAKRFPFSNNDLENYLKMIPFSLAKSVRKHLPGSSGLFFDNYIRSYELKDIRNIINGGEGFFFEKLKGKSWEIEDLSYYMKSGFWKDCWTEGFAKYKKSNDKLDIKIALDKCYYSSLLESVWNLPYGEAIDTEDFILTLINFKNRLWLYRLKDFYDLKDFTIKRFLIPEGDVYKNFSSEEGIHENVFVKEFVDICYRNFKFRMYSMRSILAFFFFLELKTDKILSIYRAKLLALEKERFREIWESLYVGS